MTMCEVSPTKGEEWDVILAMLMTIMATGFHNIWRKENLVFLALAIGFKSVLYFAPQLLQMFLRLT